ncbi:hypothetical protein SYNPS1DRAFT_11248, partial [Syncephalis pseudoplumigaleata]
MLQALRIVKLFAWEQRFYSRIDEAREKELVAGWKRYVNFSIYVGCSSVTPVVITVATLTAYTIIFKHTLTTTIAFTSIALFESLRVALIQLPNSIF